MKEQFKIGVAREIITPPLGTLLSGYVCRRPAASVNDDLTVNAIAFSQGELCGVMLSVDVVSFAEKHSSKIREMISKETGIPFKNITVSAIHTHSGPQIRESKGWGAENTEFNEQILIPQCVKAAKTAANSMRPAVMGVGVTESKVGINRREIMPDGSVRLGQNPYGVYDPEMTVVSFKGLDGEPIVNLVHYGCHGTACGRGLEITRDWPGVMVDRVAEETGAPTVFFNGAEGDVGPRISNGRTTGDWGVREAEDRPYGQIKYVYELGSVASIDAMRAYNQIKEYREVKLQIVTGELCLPYEAPPSKEEIVKKLDELSRLDSLMGVQVREYEKLKTLLKVYESGNKHESELCLEQTLIAFNSTVFVPFKFEMFSEITLRLRTYSPFQNTLSLSNTNGTEGYLPTHDQLVRGGYEIAVFKTREPYKFVDNTDDVIINENLKLLEKMEY